MKRLNIRPKLFHDCVIRQMAFHGCCSLSVGLIISVGGGGPEGSSRGSYEGILQSSIGLRRRRDGKGGGRGRDGRRDGRSLGMRWRYRKHRKWIGCRRRKRW